MALLDAARDPQGAVRALRDGGRQDGFALARVRYDGTIEGSQTR